MARNFSLLIRVEMDDRTPFSPAQLRNFVADQADSARIWLNFFTDSPTPAVVQVHPFFTPDQAAAIVDTMLH